MAKTEQDAALVDRLAADIQARVLSGEFASGSRLRQESLATEFGVSRTPVREALRKLQAAGIVQLEPRRGARVRGPSAREVREAYEVRAELEGLAAALAATRIRDEDLRRLREAQTMFEDSYELLRDWKERGDVMPPARAHADWIRGNDLFHLVILEAAGNQRLAAILSDLHQSFPRDLTWIVLGESSHLLEENVAQHAAVLRGDRGARCGGRKAADGRSRARGRQSRRETVRGARRLEPLRHCRSFIPGLELARAFYDEAVAPLLGETEHAAARLGNGSDVLGFDNERSTDHGWAPRLQLFVEDKEVARVLEAVEAGVPDEFRGWPVRFGWDDVPVSHHIDVASLATWLEMRLGFDPRDGLSTRQWLFTPQQSLLELTAGAVFHDPRGEVAAMRETLAWYPDDVWLWLLACQWRRLDQEEPFVGRAAEVGDRSGRVSLRRASFAT
jgi:DNA-binding GntR family transcriptional regulator